MFSGHGVNHGSCTSDNNVTISHHLTVSAGKSSGRALRTISCERWFSVKTFLIDFQPVLRPRPSPLPFLLLSSSQMSEDRFSSRADTREIQSETALPTTLPRRTDGVSRGQGHPTTAERVLCVLQAALSATHTHLHDGTRPPP